MRFYSCAPRMGYKAGLTPSWARSKVTIARLALSYLRRLVGTVLAAEPFRLFLITPMIDKTTGRYFSRRSMTILRSNEWNQTCLTAQPRRPVTPLRLTQ